MNTIKRFSVAVAVWLLAVCAFSQAPPVLRQQFTTNTAHFGITNLAILTNGQAGVTLSGAFTGNGAGLTNLPVTLAAGTNIVIVTNTGTSWTIHGTASGTGTTTTNFNGIVVTNTVSAGSFSGNGAGLTNLQSTNIVGLVAGSGLTNGQSGAWLIGQTNFGSSGLTNWSVTTSNGWFNTNVAGGSVSIADGNVTASGTVSAGSNYVSGGTTVMGVCGVGITNPAAKLHVAGNAIVSSLTITNVLTNSLYQGVIRATGTSPGTVPAIDISAWPSTNVGLTLAAGNVAVSTNWIVKPRSGTNASLEVWTGTNATVPTIMVTNGRVGIGRVNPTFPLEAVSIYASDTLYANFLNANSWSANNNAAMTVGAAGTVSINYRATNHNFGIGNVNITNSLTVDASVTATNFVLSTPRWTDSPVLFTWGTGGSAPARTAFAIPGPFAGISAMAWQDADAADFSVQMSHGIVESNATGYVEPHIHVFPLVDPTTNACRKKFVLVYSGASINRVAYGPVTNSVDNVLIETNKHTLVSFNHLGFTNFYPGISGIFVGTLTVTNASASNMTSGRITISGMDWHYPVDRMGSSLDNAP